MTDVVHEFPWDYTPGAVVEFAICDTCGERWDAHSDDAICAFVGGPEPELQRDAD